MGFLLCCYFFALRTNAQNLIQNGSFEDYSRPPDDISQITLARHWYPISVSADLFVDPNFINIPPVYGIAYAGMGIWKSDPDFPAQESFGQTLAQPLEAGKQYYLRLYAADAEFLEQICISVQVYGFNRRPGPMTTQPNYIATRSDAIFLGETSVINNKEFQLYEICFSPPETIRNLVLSVNDANCDHYIYLDNIELYELEEQKLFAEQAVLCSGEPITLGVDIQNAAYQWQDGSTEPFYTVTEPGIYWVGIDTVCNLELRDSIEILDGRIDLAAEFLPADTILCEDEVKEISLAVPANAPYQYRWNTNETTNDLTITTTGIYQLTISRLSCTLMDEIEVIFNTCRPCDLFVHNIFSPNDDGNNDLLEIYPTCPITTFRLLIYDRWGRLVFETQNINDFWNAKTGRYTETVQAGIYTYVIQYEGEEFGEMVSRKVVGDITIVN
ncbi:MAG: gliding motility-associated C-terminal domain-containing protein [Saprospiraceae bacterium]